MTDRTPRPFLGMSLKQGAIIAGLIGVFGFLVLGQPDGTGEQSAEETGVAEAVSGRPSSKSAVDSPAWMPRWPEIELEQALGHNPFAALRVPDEPLSPAEQAVIAAQAAEAAAAEAASSADTAANDEPDTAVAEFQSRGVSMIFRNKEKTCAVIGERVVQAGDVVDGVRVVAITNTEVIVEPANKRPE